MFVTDTLGNPDDDEGYFPQIAAAIAKSRKEANKIRREEPITVVIGNPPYKEKSMGLGGWVEGQTKLAAKNAPLTDWIPPAAWNAGAHAKHLRNLYVYFWRWATWKVYDHGPGSKNGIVCFITVAGFLNGPGFQKMRDYLRRTCDDIWVIDCSPEGHQPAVNTRIFEAVQQPVCIVLASRSETKNESVPAQVRFWQLPATTRTGKFIALQNITLGGAQWTMCPSDWRAAFLPASEGEWSKFPALDQLFADNGSGVMPRRTWVIAPDAESLQRRWDVLVAAPADAKEALFHPHMRNGTLGDKHSKKVVTAPLAGFPAKAASASDDSGPVVPPTPYGFRSFDRHWIIPDSRLINQPNPSLWVAHSSRQVT